MAHLEGRLGRPIPAQASTRRLTGGLFDYRDLGTMALKGFAENVPAWRVLGVTEHLGLRLQRERFQRFGDGLNAQVVHLTWETYWLWASNVRFRLANMILIRGWDGRGFEVDLRMESANLVSH